jgi:hypothetical protein
MEWRRELVARLAPAARDRVLLGADLDREQAVAGRTAHVPAGAALAVVTRGRSGSMALNSAIVEVPAQPVGWSTRSGRRRADRRRDRGTGRRRDRAGAGGR